MTNHQPQFSTPFVDTPKRKRRDAVDPNGYKVLSVRLRAAEFEGLSEQASALGLTNNMAMRIAARRISGFLEIDDATRQTLQKLTQNIGDVSSALSQLHKIARQDGTVDMEHFAEQRTAFGQEFAQLDVLLQTLLNVSLRRNDGRMMLQNAK